MHLLHALVPTTKYFPVYVVSCDWRSFSYFCSNRCVVWVLWLFDPPPLSLYLYFLALGFFGFTLTKFIQPCFKKFLLRPHFNRFLWHHIIRYTSKSLCVNEACRNFGLRCSMRISVPELFRCKMWFPIIVWTNFPDDWENSLAWWYSDSRHICTAGHIIVILAKSFKVLKFEKNMPQALLMYRPKQWLTKWHMLGLSS